MSTISKNKVELLLAIHSAFEKLYIDYNKIAPNATRVLGVEGNKKGSQISVCDTLAYLIGWQNLVLKWHYRTEHSLPVNFPKEGFNWQQLGELAQHFYQQYQDWTYDALFSEFKATTERLITLVNSLENEALYGQPWYKTYTLGRMIQFNSSAPMKNMRTKVRKFIKTHPQELV